MILLPGLPPDRGRPAGQAPKCSTSLTPSVAPIAIGPNIAAVPETSCPQTKQTWRLKISMRSRIVNSTISGSAASLTTDCMLGIFLCLVLAHAGLFSVGVFHWTPTLVSLLPAQALEPSDPHLHRSPSVLDLQFLCFDGADEDPPDWKQLGSRPNGKFRLIILRISAPFCPLSCVTKPAAMPASPARS